MCVAERPQLKTTHLHLHLHAMTCHQINCNLFIYNILNVKKILAVINATYAVAKRKPEKSRLAGIRIPGFESRQA